MRHYLLICLIAVVAGAGCIHGTGDSPSDSNIPQEESPTAASWCEEGETYTTSTPQTGERSTLRVEGVVEHDGRQTCKAVLKGTVDGEIARIETFYTQEQEYVHQLMYDANETLRYEYRQTAEEMYYRAYNSTGGLEQETTGDASQQGAVPAR